MSAPTYLPFFLLLVVLVCVRSFTISATPFSLAARKSLIERRAFLRQQGSAQRGDFNDDTPSTLIGRDTKIRADQFHSKNSLVIEGELSAKDLRCEGELIVTQGGHLKGQVRAEGLVTIDGQLEGNLICSELVVGPGGMVTGDVTCRNL